MEATVSCVKALLAAAHQYLNNACDANLVNLQRQMDILINMCTKSSVLRFFNAKEPLTTECLACLVSLMNDPKIHPTLAQKTMTLLRALASQTSVRDSLHAKFHLTASLSAYLSTLAASSADPNCLLCVQLLQKVTYNCRVSTQDTYVENLLFFVIKQLKCKESELTLPSLGLLDNLSRHNYSVQLHLKNMNDSNKLLKVLLQYLGHNSCKMNTFALSVIASIWLDDIRTDKLFGGQNMNQVFKTLFNTVLMTSGSDRKYAVDLFVHLNRQPKIYNALITYPPFARCVDDTIQKLCLNDVGDVIKIFELLLSFCSVNGLRCTVCHALLESPSLKPQEKSSDQKYKQILSLSPDADTEPFNAVLHWAGQSVETHDAAPLLALDFLNQVFEELLDLGLTASITPRLRLILSFLQDTLTTPLSQEGADVKSRCHKLVKTLRLALTICTDSALRNQLISSMSVTACVNLVQYQFTHNSALLGESSSEDWWEHGVDVALFTLDLMLQLKNSEKMDTALCDLLKDVRLVPFLAVAMTSDCRERVHVAMRLVARGTTQADFPHSMLGDAITGQNCHKKSLKEKSGTGKESELLPPPPPSSLFKTPPEKSTFSPVEVPERDSSLDASVQSLIEKMQDGLDLQDVRHSDLISVYEHRVQSLQTRENHLQDMLDVKAMELSQADRLIAHYRCRMAQSEAEGHKMRTLLQEREKESDAISLKLKHLTMGKETLQTELEVLNKENTRLMDVAEEHRDLQKTFNDQSLKMENLQRSLTSLRQEHKTLSEMHEMSRRHHETLKAQHDTALQQLGQLEDEKNYLTRALNESKAKEKDLTKSLSRAEERLKKLTRDYDELESAIDQFRSDLASAEQNEKKLNEKVTSLELLCRQRETLIAEKESELKKCRVEIDKHNQIAALIHNLSSGKEPATLGKGPII